MQKFLVASLLVMFHAFLTCGAWAGAPAHPLEPLTSEEIGTASDLLLHYKDFPKGALFPMIALREPPKSEILAYKPGAPFRREAFATILDRAANQTYEAVVDLNGKKVVSFARKPGVQPLVLVSEYDLVPKIVKADPRWQAAMKKRGITDFDKVWVDTWATGNMYPKSARGTRILRGISYWKDGATNFYGRPIEGVVAIVDMNHEKVLELIDTGVKPVAKFTQEFDPASIGEQRKDLKPLRITTPDGPSYTVNGHEISWQKWKFRYAMHPREGLILYQVSYNDGGKERPIIYRASLSETVVPYGDPDPNWSWRNAFDEGEYGMGRLMSTLDPKMDGPENAQYFDADFTDDFGKPYTQKNVVGIYEREAGYLWKHYDIYTYKNEARRARDLVLYSVAAVGNYDYVFSWIFHQDGSLDCDVGLTGIMLPKGVAQESMLDTMADGHHLGAHGHLVAKNVVAPHHQHFINYRIDFDVDGEKNVVMEMNSSSMPKGKDNPAGNGILMQLTQLKSEKVAERDLSLEHARKWIVVNPSIKNELGYSPGYALIPGDNSIPYISKDSPVRKRGGFINHQFWATQYHEDENYAGGYYPNQSEPGYEGLEKWASNNESLDNQDVVVWYTFGVTHIPRPEEWPVMAMAHAGFKLAPVAFFTRNPGMDVPR
jgi:primary-amine oxidase